LLAQCAQRKPHIHPQLVRLVGTRPLMLARLALGPQLGVDRADVPKRGLGGAPRILRRHALLDEFARAHLEMKAELVADVARGVRLEAAKDSTHGCLRQAVAADSARLTAEAKRDQRFLSVRRWARPAAVSV